MKINKFLVKKKKDLYRVEDCMKRFCDYSIERKIINFEKKKMVPLTNKENESYLKQALTFAEKGSDINTVTIENIIELEVIAMIHQRCTTRHIHLLFYFFSAGC